MSFGAHSDPLKEQPSNTRTFVADPTTTHQHWAIMDARWEKRCGNEESKDTAMLPDPFLMLSRSASLGNPEFLYPVSLKWIPFPLIF